MYHNLKQENIVFNNKDNDYLDYKNIFTKFCISFVVFQLAVLLIIEKYFLHIF